MRILDGEPGASTFKVILRVWISIQWKEGPPGPGPTGLVPWCGRNWRHPNCPGHFQRNKEGGRTPQGPYWKRLLLWSKMHFSRNWRVIPWFSKMHKVSALFWRHVEASSLWGQWWEGSVLKTIQHSLLEGAEDDQCPDQGCSVLEPPYHLGWDRPHRHPTGPVGSQLIGYRPLAGAWSANITCHFGWQIFCLIPFVHINFVLKKSNSSLSFVVCGFGSRSKKSWPNPKSWSFSLMFSYMGCIILVLTYRPLIHFELILNSEGNRDATLFFCIWDLVVPAPVLIVGENICKWCHQKCLISKIHKQNMNLKKIN